MLFQTGTSKKFERLQKLLDEREGLTARISRIDEEVQQLRQELNSILNPGAPKPNNNIQASFYSTQHGTQAVSGKLPIAKNHHHQKQTREIPPQATYSEHADITAAKGTVIAGMADAIGRRIRCQDSTSMIRVASIEDEGVLVAYDHYLYGDGVSSGIPTPSGVPCTVKTSGAGSTYRLIKTPALKVTCKLEAPLPQGVRERKGAIEEWLAANGYLCGDDPTRAQFSTDFNIWGREYCPYISVDGKGTYLYVYIGATSLTDPRPVPTLIA
jgi:hypothetical protein